MALLPAVELEYPRGVTVDATIIWLHGLGADGNDFAPVVPQLGLPSSFGVRFIFPHAPSIPVTINNGYVMPAWYDIKLMDIDRHVDQEQLLQSARWVHDFIDREIGRGISSKRIIVAGFSQGGAVAFQAGLTYPQPLGGIMALSTYFATADIIQIDPVQNTIPVLICHGTGDTVVPEALGLKSQATLQNLGFVPEYNSYPMEHSVCLEEIRDIGDWITRSLAKQDA